MHAQTLDKVSVPAVIQLSHVSLNPLSATQPQNIHYSSHSPLVQPLNSSLQNKMGSPLFPWDYFLKLRGLFPVALDHTGEVGPLVFSSLACLGPEGRSLVHGEFLGMSLLLEEVLQSSVLFLTLQHEMEMR